MKSIKKILIIAAFVIGSLIALFAVLVVTLMLSYTADNRIASSPDRIARNAGLKLPGYEVLDYSDNFDRGSSAWSCTEWTLSLKDPVPEKLREKLNLLSIRDGQWSCDMSRGTYQYIRKLNGMNDSPEVHIVIDMKARTVHMYYCWWDFLS